MAKKEMSMAFNMEGKLASSFKDATRDAANQLSKVDKKARAIQAAQKRQDATALKNLSKAARDASSAFGGLKNEVTGTFKIIAGLVAGNGILGASIYGVAKSSAAAVNALGDNAEITGLNTDLFRELAHAADRAGMSEQEFISSTLALGDTVKKALGGNQKAVDAFFRAGIELRDGHGNIKTTNQLYRELAETFAKMEDGMGKSSLAKDLLGSAKVLPLLNGGTAGLDAMAAEARRFGPIISDADIANARAFNNSFSRIKSAISGVTQTIGKELWPLLTGLHEEIANGIAENRIWLEKELPGWIAAFKEELPGLKEELRAAWASLKDGARWVNDLAQSMGGWVPVLKSIIKYWLVWRGIRMVAMFAQTASSIFTLGKAFIFALPAIKAFGIALMANPIGLAIAGIVALGAAIYLCVKYWDEIKAAVADTWETTKGVFVSGWNMLPDWLTGPLSEMASKVSDFGSKIAGAVGQMWDMAVASLRQRFSAVSDAFDQGFFTGIAEAFNQFSPGPLILDMLDGIVGAIRDFDILSAGMDLIISFGKGMLQAWDDIKGEIAAAVTDWIPGGKTIANMAGGVSEGLGSAAGWLGGKLSSISPFADGGIVRSPTLGLVGEAGPEVIVPVNRPRRGGEMLDAAAGMLGRGQGGGGAVSYTISFAPTFQLTGGADASVAQQIQQAYERAKADLLRTLPQFLSDHAHREQRVALR